MRTTLRALIAPAALIGLLALPGAAGAQGAIQMTVNDPVPVTEGTGANTTVKFVISLSAPAPQGGVRVDYTTADDSARAPGDYTAKSAPGPGLPALQFNEGEVSHEIPVTIVGDAKDEIDEQFELRLSNVVPNNQVVLADAVGKATIKDDDAPPTVSVSDALVQGGAVTTGTNRLVIFDVKLSAPSDKVVTVDYTTEDGTAKACTTSTCISPSDGDYHALSGTLTFNPGISVLQVSIVAIGDSLDVNKTFKLKLLNRTHLRSSSAAFEAGDVGKAVTVGGVANEIAGLTTSGVVLKGVAENGGPIPFSYRPGYNDGAVSGGNQLQSNKSPFAPGDVGKAITISGQTRTIASWIDARTITFSGGNLADGAGRVFSFLRNFTDGVVQGGAHQTLADGTGVGSIPSAGPNAKITGATVTEGAAGTTSLATLSVTLDNASPQALSLAIASSDSSARAPGDYDPLPAGGRVTFAPGERTKQITMTVKGNDVDENDRAFNVVLSDPQNVQLTATNATGVVTIRDDDQTPGLVVSDVSVPEPRLATSTVDVEVKLRAPSVRKLTSPYTTEDGTAIAGTHYQRTAGTLTFEPGQTSAVVSIPIAGDGRVTDDLGFVLALQDTAEGGGRVAARVTLIDSDLSAEQQPSISVNDVTVRRASRTGVTPAEFTVRLDRALTRQVRVDYTTEDATAKASQHYTPTRGTLTFPAGETTQPISVPVTASGGRPNLTFKVVLSNPQSARLARAVGSGIIIDAAPRSLPVRITPRRVKINDVLCPGRRSRCRGMRVRWTAPAAGKVRVRVTAQVPRGTRGRTKRLQLFSRTVKVKKGTRSMLARRGAGKVASRQRAALRKARVKKVRVTTTYIDRLGAQRDHRADVVLRR